MATKREKNGRWEFVVKRAALLPKPLYYTFDDEAEGDAFIAKLERMLDSGIVPTELLHKKANAYRDIGNVIREYLLAVSIPPSDKSILNTQIDRIGGVEITKVNYLWVEAWIFSMKSEYNLSPDTIRHHVGALARCFDWAGRRNIVALIVNPIRQLPRGYATYSQRDIDAAKAFDDSHEEKGDGKRERRIETGEEPSIRRIMSGVKAEGRERPLELEHQAAIELLFDMAIETAMRMREMYCLSISQIDLEKKTIFLDRTKNGNNRQVPLSKKIIELIIKYMDHVKNGTRGMDGFSFDSGLLFPWWDGDLGVIPLRQTTQMISKKFARIFEAAGCPSLRFHDLRHEATSRLFERTKLTEFQIMKITGHSSTKMLARYANLRASDLADLLN